MEPERSEGETPEYDARAEGKAWCPACDGERSFRVEKLEFLGNPVKASCFCLQCGGRLHPGATDARSARRLRAQGRWLRMGAAGSFFLMLLFPILIILALLGLLWRLL